jgi:hypothetical protein
MDKCRECDKDRSIHNFKGCLYRVKQINLHLIVYPHHFRHTKRLPIRISKPSHKKFHFKNI